MLGNKKLAVFGIASYFLLFLWRYSLLKPRSFPPDTKVEIVSVLASEPEVSGKSQYFKVAGFKIRTRRYPEYHYGDKLKITGTIGRYRTISFPSIIRLKNQPSNQVLKAILSFRKRMEAAVKSYLPEPQASLLIGMLLGIKDLSYELSNSLKRSGLIHIVVASGSNVTLVASFFLYLSGFIKRKNALILSLLAIIFYTLMVGAQPPIIRAALMGGLSYLAKIFGRQSYQVLTLILVAGAMLLCDPFYLFDLSFQLSFLATAGIILFAPILLKFLRDWQRGLAVAFATTVSAQLFVTPLIVSAFGQFSLFSLITNCLVYPMIGPIMILGFPLAVFAVVAPIVARALSFILWPLLTYFVWVTRFFGNLNFSLLGLPKLPFPIFLPYYLFWVHLWFRFQNSPSTPNARMPDRPSKSPVRIKMRKGAESA